MSETVYRIPPMCCPMEERLIRNRLKGYEGIEELRFDILERKLTVATLWMAVFADMDGSSLVVTNGLRRLRFEKGANP